MALSSIALAASLGASADRRKLSSRVSSTFIGASMSAIMAASSRASSDAVVATVSLCAGALGLSPLPAAASAAPPLPFAATAAAPLGPPGMPGSVGGGPSSAMAVCSWKWHLRCAGARMGVGTRPQSAGMRGGRTGERARRTRMGGRRVQAHVCAGAPEVAQRWRIVPRMQREACRADGLEARLEGRLPPEHGQRILRSLVVVGAEQVDPHIDLLHLGLGHRIPVDNLEEIEDGGALVVADVHGGWRRVGQPRLILGRLASQGARHGRATASAVGHSGDRHASAPGRPTQAGPASSGRRGRGAAGGVGAGGGESVRTDAHVHGPVGGGIITRATRVRLAWCAAATVAATVLARTS